MSSLRDDVEQLNRIDSALAEVRQTLKKVMDENEKRQAAAEAIWGSGVNSAGGIAVKLGEAQEKLDTAITTAFTAQITSVHALGIFQALIDEAGL